MTVASEQVAGVYRRKVGDVLVTALNDGGIELPAEIFIGITPEDRISLLRAGGRRPPFSSAVNTFVLQSDGRTVLVDTGCGKAFGDAGGRMPANMHAAGISPADVTDVVITHLHGDHFGGLLGGAGTPAFPRAALWVAEQEIAFWQSDEMMAKAPQARQSGFEGARKAVAPYADRTRRFAYGEIMPGLEAVALPGHTPGHTGFMLTSGGEKLLIWGDIFHLPVVQAARPAVGTAFDSDPAQATQTRIAILERAVKEDLLVTGMHMSFPGFARIARSGDAYAVQPEVWQPTL